MKSMTGHGGGDCAREGFKVSVEVTSVNRKQSEITVVLPPELDLLEAQIREAVNRRLARGRITVRVNLQANQDRLAKQVRVNTTLAEAYAREFGKLAKKLKLPGGVSLELLTRAPGVLESEEATGDPERFWPLTETALKKALDEMVKMREREGAHLRKDLHSRIEMMREATALIARQAPQVLEKYRVDLMHRIRNAGLETIDASDERLLKEIVLFADRSDISEELTRLQSHFQQYDDCAKSAEPVGRTLDFLAQEMNREINTIGSKANDSVISRAVVTLKTELEKFREQAQNVE